MNNWYQINFDSENSVAHVFLKDDIGCYGRTSGDLTRELLNFAPAKLELEVNSSGGSSVTGLNLCETFRYWPTKATIYGRACSSALIAAMSATEILILPTARILVHSPVSFVCGTAEELRAEATAIESLKHQAAELLSTRTRQPLNIVAGWLSRDTWFTAAEAVAAGLADGLADLPASRPARAVKSESIASAEQAPTVEEKFFRQWLAAQSPLPVASRQRFIDGLVQWANTNTIEL